MPAMNIALFSDCYTPTKNGVVTVIIQLRKMLEQMGHHVVVVAVGTGDNDDPNVLTVPSVPLGLGTDQMMGFPHMSKIIKFLKEHSIEIIHCHTEFYVAHAAKTTGRKLHIPVVVTTHTMWEDFYMHYFPIAKYVFPVKLLRKLAKRLYKKFYAIINVSEKAETYFKQPFLLPHTPSAIIPNAIDVDAFRKRSATPEDIERIKNKWGIKQEDTVLLFVGRIAEEKRVIELLDICGNVISKNPSAKMLFVGNGPAFDELENIAATKSYRDRIVFTGYVDWADISSYYKLGDIFVTASMSEMHSMTILEAMFSGLPVVTRDDTSYHDTIFNGQNGYLAQTDSEMEERICELVKDKEKRLAFGKNSEKISAGFSIDVHTKKTVAFYQAVLDAFPQPLNESKLREIVYNIK